MAENVLATNFHVIDGALQAEIKLLGIDQAYRVSGVVAVNKQRDLVLLQVSKVLGIPLRLASATQPEVGEEVYACGNPGGLEGTISPGIVSSVTTRRIEGEDLIQITARGYPEEVRPLILGFFLRVSTCNALPHARATAPLLTFRIPTIPTEITVTRML